MTWWNSQFVFGRGGGGGEAPWEIYGSDFKKNVEMILNI